MCKRSRKILFRGAEGAQNSLKTALRLCRCSACQTAGFKLRILSAECRIFLLDIL